MTIKKLTIIGAGSDLIRPLLEDCNNLNINLQEIKRKDWDLLDSFPSEDLLKKIINFQPNHLLFAAGMNNVLNIQKKNTSEVIKHLENHLKVNSISFLTIVDLLQKKLDKKLTSVHVISSLYGIYGRRTRLSYSISKHTLEAMVKCLALEYPDTQFLGYRPGFFNTKLTSANLSDRMKTKLFNRIANKRFGSTKEFSKVVLNNIVNSVPYLTGTFITIDGGMSSGGFFEP